MRIISGQWRGRSLAAPRGVVTRPTSDRTRGSLFSLLLSLPREIGGPPLVSSFAGLRILDLYCGTGAIGFEALSRGASHAVLVDCDKEALACARSNARELGCAERVSLVKGVLPLALEALPQVGAIDLVFADAPYAIDMSETLLALAQRSTSLLTPHATVVAEVARGSRPNAGSLRLRHARTYGDTELLFFVSREGPVRG